MAKKKTRKTYTETQKERVVRHSHRHGVPATATKFGVNESSVYAWRRVSNVVDRNGVQLVGFPTTEAPTPKGRAALELFHGGWSIYQLHEALGMTEKGIEELLRDALVNTTTERD